MQRILRQRWIRNGAAGILTVALIGAGCVFLWIDRNLTLAQHAIDNGDWKSARDNISVHLRFKRADAAAHLLMAEALIRDDSLVGTTKVYEALEHLNQVRETSAKAADARLYEGRLYLLLLLQPGQAEKSLLSSLKQDPNRLESHSLLWRLYDLTNRWDLAEEHFWSIYDRVSPADREGPLRDWYLSEFSPGAANAQLDRNLGFLGRTELPSAETDRRRLEAFLSAETEWADGYVILARWFKRQSAIQDALSLLERAERLPGAAANPMLIATRVSIDVEFGEFEHAQQVFDRWSTEREGYEYWKTAGLVADQIRRDNEQAVADYERAMETTPGKSDWLTQHRLAQCLLRMGETERAAIVRSRSKQVELLMESALHTRLRKALLTPRNPQTIAEMVDLYQKLGRLREVSAWQQLRPNEQNSTSVTPRQSSPTTLAGNVAREN